MPLSSTAFAAYRPAAARAVLALTVCAAAALAALSLSPWASGFADKPSRGAGDIELYRAEVTRVQQGAGYFDAANAELRARGYTTGSVFNWRSPLPVWLLGALPSFAIGKSLLGGLCVWAAAQYVQVVSRERRRGSMALGLLLLSGALLPCCLGDLCVLPELWAGVLLLLAVTAYGRGHHRAAAVWATLAAVMRELALPVLLLGLGLALWERRWRDAIVWWTGVIVFSAFYIWHLAQVAQFIQPGDRVHDHSWLRLGGAAFLLSLAQMNAYLLLLPQWVTAIFLTLTVLGFAGWSAPSGRFAGLVAAGYLATFAAIGQPFNQYWGSLLAPLFCLGFAHAPAALRDLCQTANSTVANELAATTIH